MKKHFSIREAFSFAISTFKKRPMFFIGLTLLSSFISFFVSFMVDAFELLFLSRAPGFASFFMRGVGQILIFLVSMYVYISITRLYLLTVDGKNPTFRELFDLKKDLFIQYIILFLVMSFLILLGLLAFVIPGIFLALILQYSMLSLIDDNKGVRNSMRASRLITKGVRLKLFSFQFFQLSLRSVDY